MRLSDRFISACIGTMILILPGAASAAGAAPQPNICTRACWGATSASGITYMSSLTRAIVHHTAGSEFNTTGLEASKANVRAIQSYHKSQGWGDIGYHFLIDKFGNIFEGRFNSMSALPRGIHDAGNTNSFGFTLMGYFHPNVNNVPTTAMMNAYYDVIAWRMPGGWTPYGSPGGSYGQLGNDVGRLDAHRRVVATACPGDYIYNVYMGTNLNAGAMRNEVANRINGLGAEPSDEQVVLLPDNRLASVAVFTDSTVRANAQIAPGSSWGGWGTLAGSGFNKISALNYPDGRLVTFGVGTGNVWVNAQIAPNSSWGGWGSLGGPTFSYVDGIMYTDQRLAVAAVGNGTAVWINAQVTAGGGWGGWGNLGGSGFNRVDVVKLPDERLAVFAVGGGTVFMNTQNYANGTWGGWQDTAGPTFSTVRGVVRADGRMVAVASGTGTSIWMNSQLAGGSWTGWQNLGGPIGFHRVDPVITTDGRLALFGVGASTPIYINAQYAAEGAWGGWQSLGGGGFHTVNGLHWLNDRFCAFGHGPGGVEYVNAQTVAGGAWGGWSSIDGTLR